MLPFRSGRSLTRGAAGIFVLAALLCLPASGADQKGKPAKEQPKPKSSPSAVSGIPLPIGQEIKGLVLPDFDLNGHLRTRFEAGTAKRIDNERIQFTGLKVISFTPENTIDLQIDLPESIFDLNTRLLRSQQRTTIRRADFEIAGDTLQFNTTDRKGTLTGNVKMVISDSSTIVGKKDQ